MRNASAEQSNVLGDLQNYTRGTYIAFASPWSIWIPPNDRLVRGVDYEDTIEIIPGTFPDGSIIRWRWPNSYPVNAGVWGYMALSHGNYDNGSPEVAVTPWQVGNIKSWVEEVAFSLTGDSNGHDVLNEFYLTSRPGDAAAKLFEIGLLLHTSPRDANFVASSKLIGMFIDSDQRSWSVVNAGTNPQGSTFIIFMPVDREDVRSKIDLKAMLFYLMSQRVITGAEWINGVALGVEPHRGAGAMTISRWKAAFEGQVVAPSNVALPMVTGTPSVGQILTCDPGGWAGGPTFAFQWIRDAIDIGGAQKATYRTVAADQGASLACKVLAQNSQSASSATSSPVTVVD